MKTTSQTTFHVLKISCFVKGYNYLHGEYNICSTYKSTDQLKSDARADAERTSGLVKGLVRFSSGLGSHFTRLFNNPCVKRPCFGVTVRNRFASFVEFKYISNVNVYHSEAIETIMKCNG